MRLTAIVGKLHAVAALMPKHSWLMSSATAGETQWHCRLQGGQVEPAVMTVR